MKVVILAGGYGTRISEESHLRPKPMIEIGGKPILWHIMKIYSHYGFNDFVICLGYRGYMIKEYFSNYILHSSDVTFDMKTGETTYHANHAEPWRVTLVDTGLDTLTGGRIKRVAAHIDGPFCLTYGDGVADVDIGALVAFHRAQGRAATVTSVVPPGRYGALSVDNGRVLSFVEKPAGDNGRINGGFFVLEPSILDRIEGDRTTFEGGPLEGLTTDGELAAFDHDGFWRPMDTLRDKNQLEELWERGKAPWKVWA
ncbi:glucose-1-phosphate cytidylyltransferase [Siculibacillus lacustris]|uniref:Glucose-1-phosphate cytidylyltransferase n=1 Tax=Siculibacillus lacustris TaxID=1549641 RepID=A0A4Q9VQY7_9HYPH|nr:glucose-1-phosphate cytidylyltransferase [Siculibacillus lacustris]TBW38272.1 glucose-1-phosphate cytidylyltransferase [Siculibacillus lacustris]